MNAIAICGTGMVSSVGYSAASSCAAIRAKLSTPSETTFIDPTGEWINGHAIDGLSSTHGFDKLERMASRALRESLQLLEANSWPQVPLLLCVAEKNRPGRSGELDDELFLAIEKDLGCELSRLSTIIAEGRVGVVPAIQRASQLLHSREVRYVAILAVDSLLTGPSIRRLVEQERLLTAASSNGFMPGEAACALLLALPSGGPELLCEGVGRARETATIDIGGPLRAEGLTTAIRAALADGECQLHEVDFRIADVAGEQYYFKEAAIALSRNLRRHRERFEFWHPAESVGDVGAAIGPIVLAVADMAFRKRYAPGRRVLCHFSADAGGRAALVLRYSQVTADGQ